MQTRDYPDFLENAWLSRAISVTRAPDAESALESLRPAVKELSDLFTTDRPEKGFHDYAADPKLLTAYGLFFFPQSFVKCDTALRSIAETGRLRPPAGEGPIRILDLGSASGPCGFAAALAMQAIFGRPVHLTALDHSPAALAELVSLAHAIPGLTIETRVGDMRRAADTLKSLPPQNLITVGFALNEVAMDNAGKLAWVNALRPLLVSEGTLLLLEPALRETAESVRRLRNALLTNTELYPIGPDVESTPCPFLAAKSPYWDHEAREWTAPASLEFLNRKLHRDLRALKFAVLAVSPSKPDSLPDNTYRLVTPPDLQKAGIIFTAVGKAGTLTKFTIPTRGISKSESKEITRKLNRGDYITIDINHTRENNAGIIIPSTDLINRLGHPLTS